jgi:uncharacterized membrane protein (Fun14 family)
MNPTVQRILGPVLGAAVASGDGPWRAKTVHLALFVVVVGLGFWLHGAAKGPPPPAPAGVTAPAREAASGGGWDFARPVPGYVQICASYIGDFFIGWALRRFLRLALAVAVLAVLLVGLGKYAGWNTSPAETDVKERAVWVQHEATAAKDYLKGLLPSTSAAAVGAFFGFRRKGKLVAPPDGPSDFLTTTG